MTFFCPSLCIKHLHKEIKVYTEHGLTYLSKCVIEELEVPEVCDTCKDIVLYGHFRVGRCNQEKLRKYEDCFGLILYFGNVFGIQVKLTIVYGLLCVMVMQLQMTMSVDVFGFAKVRFFTHILPQITCLIEHRTKQIFYVRICLLIWFLTLYLKFIL